MTLPPYSSPTGLPEVGSTEPPYSSASSPATTGGADAVQEREAAPLDAREQAGDGETLGGGNTPWTPTGEGQEVIRQIAAYCRTYCPAFKACVEERCRLWRLEQEAAAYLEGPTQEVIGL